MSCLSLAYLLTYLMTLFSVLKCCTADRETEGEQRAVETGQRVCREAEQGNECADGDFTGRLS